ncbi:MAG TPA: YebC/PmpR family DNA-binding transcriptional regulator, partial [Chlamydiales bacterium]|nr:YebC/PmpR family DNA-binding transcriptional regulator [Chlamydiales bacterium]
MAGHSKWANIKHRKGKADAKKGKLFTRAAKEIINSVKLGGPDPKGNSRLRLALQKAKECNMPNDNVERLIKKASSADQEAYEEMTYELYGYHGVGIIVDAMSSNKNRMASDIRIATNKRGGTIAQPGAVSFNFDRKGVISVSKHNAIEEELFEAATNAGAEDFSDEGESFVIICDPADLLKVKEAIAALGFQPEEAAIHMIPKNYIECDEEATKANLALIEWLETIDDVDDVHHNM